MNNNQESTVEDVHKTMMFLEQKIFNDKKLIRGNSNNEEAMLAFSDHTFTLLIKRLKHSFYLKNQNENGDRFEELVSKNKEAFNPIISANAIKVMMNVTIYNISLEDTFIELLKDYSEYLKPIINAAIK